MSEEEKISSAVAFTVITELRDQLKIKDMRIQKLKQKIEKYKDLLKECRPYIGYDTYEFDEKINKLLIKIDEVSNA